MANKVYYITVTVIGEKTKSGLKGYKVKSSNNKDVVLTDEKGNATVECLGSTEIYVEGNSIFKGFASDAANKKFLISKSGK